MNTTTSDTSVRDALEHKNHSLYVAFMLRVERVDPVISLGEDFWFCKTEKWPRFSQRDADANVACLRRLLNVQDVDWYDRIPMYGMHEVYDIERGTTPKGWSLFKDDFEDRNLKLFIVTDGVHQWLVKPEGYGYARYIGWLGAVS